MEPHSLTSVTIRPKGLDTFFPFQSIGNHMYWVEMDCLKLIERYPHKDATVVK